MPKISLREEHTPQRFAPSRTASSLSPPPRGAPRRLPAGRRSPATAPQAGLGRPPPAAPPLGRGSLRGPAGPRPPPPARQPSPPPPLRSRGAGSRGARPAAPLQPRSGRRPPLPPGRSCRGRALRGGLRIPPPRPPHTHTTRREMIQETMAAPGGLGRRPGSRQRREAALKGQVPAASAAPPRVLEGEEPTRRRQRAAARPQHPAPRRCGAPGGSRRRGAPGGSRRPSHRVQAPGGGGGAGPARARSEAGLPPAAEGSGAPRGGGPAAPPPPPRGEEGEATYWGATCAMQEGDRRASARRRARVPRKTA